VRERSGSSKRRRRWVAWRLLLLATLAALAGTLAAAATESPISAAPVLVVDNSFALDTLDPQRAFDPTSNMVDRAIYDTLFAYRGNVDQPAPLLVQSWSSTGAKTFTFTLRSDVHFADGTPLTSADVVFSLRRLVNLKGNPSQLLPTFTVTARSRYSFVISTPTPTPQLPAILASSATGIVNSKLVEAHGGTDAADASTADKAEQWFNSPAAAGAGSGPFVLQSLTPTSQVVLSPNKNPWGSRLPAFRTVVVRNMPAASQYLNIRRGSHEVATDLSSDQAQSLATDKSLHVTRQPGALVFYAFTNDDPQVSSITSSKEFQQAVRYALDYTGIVTLGGPGAIQAPGLFPSTLLGALSPASATKQDLAKAMQDLAASGVGSQQVTLEYPSDVTFGGLSFATLAQKVQADLQAAGFNVVLAGSPVTTFQPKFRAGQVAFGLWIYGPYYPDPSSYLAFTPGQLIALHAGWAAGADPGIEELAARALGATTPALRRTLYQQIQLDINADGPFVPLVQPTQVYVATSDLAVGTTPLNGLDITQVSPR
jgi:peptide/nickel transport system substrate-binding protein